MCEVITACCGFCEKLPADQNSAGISNRHC